MEKTTILIIPAMILIFFIAVTQAAGQCTITWEGDTSGSISTTETSRTALAVTAAYDAIQWTYSNTGSETASWLADGCYGYEPFGFGAWTERRVCPDGTWSEGYGDTYCSLGEPYVMCEHKNGTWDVVCDAYSVFGTISGAIQEGVTVEIYRTACGGNVFIAETTTDQNGYYLFGALETGQLLVVPTADNYDFMPVHSWPVIPQAEIQAHDFTATEN